MVYVRYDRKTSLVWAGGTGSTPVAEATYRVAELPESIEQSNALADDNYVGAYQPGPARVGGRWGELTFVRDLIGSDTADVPPADGSLLRACGFAETANGSSPDWGYKYALADPHADTGTPAGETEAVAFKLYQDLLYRQVTNCVGSVAVEFTAGQHAKLRYNFRGQIPSTPGNGGIYGSPVAFTAEPNPIPVQSSAFQITLARSGTVSGTCTGTTSTTILKDTGATFITSGVLFGDTITLTIGSETATVVSVDSETQLTSTPLSGSGTYDTGEAYTIPRAASYTVTNLVVPSITYDVGNIIDPRDDINGSHGFSEAIITGRQPNITMLVEVPSWERFNFERTYILAETLDLQWGHEIGLGDRHELTCKCSGVINAMPVLSNRGGKLVYTITMDQGIETGDDPFEMSWQGT